VPYGRGRSARLPVAVQDRGAQCRCRHPERREDKRHRPFVDGEKAESEMLDTDLGAVLGLRLMAGVLSAQLDARTVREENPVSHGAGHPAGVQPG
jgi:hypothetical protein